MEWHLGAGESEGLISYLDFLSHQIWQCHWRAADDDGLHRDLPADEAAWPPASTIGRTRLINEVTDGCVCGRAVSV